VLNGGNFLGIMLMLEQDGKQNGNSPGSTWQMQTKYLSVILNGTLRRKGNFKVLIDNNTANTASEKPQNRGHHHK
jgi:hypothetical protein